MRRFFSSTIIAAAIAACSTSLSIAQELKKVGSVNTQTVLQEFWKTGILEKELKDEQEKIKVENETQLAEIKELNDEILKLREQLNDPNIPRAERDKLQEEFQLKFNRVNNSDRVRRDYIEGKLKALNVHKNTKQREMLTDIRTVVAKYATENGYDAIVDKGTYLFLKDEFEVTDAILGLLNADQKDDSPEEPAPVEGGGE